MRAATGVGVLTMVVCVVQVTHVRNSNSVYEAFQPELWRFGIVQHSERGWYHLDAEAEHVMRADGIQPDTCVFCVHASPSGRLCPFLLCVSVARLSCVSYIFSEKTRTSGGSCRRA